MEPDRIRDVIVASLCAVAPEVEADKLVADRPLRSQIDLDSMDWLNFLIGLHQKLSVDIPESDYGMLRTLDDLTGYLRRKLG